MHGCVSNNHYKEYNPYDCLQTKASFPHVTIISISVHYNFIMIYRRILKEERLLE